MVVRLRSYVLLSETKAIKNRIIYLIINYIHTVTFDPDTISYSNNSTFNGPLSGIARIKFQSRLAAKEQQSMTGAQGTADGEEMSRGNGRRGVAEIHSFLSSRAEYILAVKISLTEYFALLRFAVCV